jgi:hypothetical protein
VLAAILFAFAVAADAQQRPSGAAIEKALADYVRQMDDPAEDQGPELKAVPRTDKAEATIIGAVDFVDATDFLDDGTPFRIVSVFARRPFDQDVLVVCLGSFLNTQCGRLAFGRRAQFTADVLVVEDGESAGLALLVVKKLKT